MKLVFAGTLVVLLGMSLYSVRLAPKVQAGKTRLTWATDNNPVRAGQVALFNKLNPDLELVIDPANRDQQKVIVQSFAGLGPDVFDSFGLGSLEAYVKAGIVLDITDKLHDVGVVPERDVWPVALPSFVFEGRAYGFPCNVNANAVWFNKDVFDRERLPYPKSGWTWEELLATAQRLTKKDARGKPLRFGFAWDFGATPDLLFQFGAHRFNATGTECLIDSPEAVAAYQLSRDIMYKFNVSPTPAQQAALASAGGWGNDSNMGLLLSGKVAMAYGGRWWLNLIRQTPNRPRLGAVEIPYARIQATGGGARCALVNRFSKQPAAAIRFAQFLASQEYNELVNDQADALAPLKAACQTPRFLRNPKYPEEDFNDVWRRAVEKAKPDEISPFATGSELAPLNTQIDLIRNDSKPVAAALRAAAKEMNDRMRRNAKRRPYLRELWTKLRGEQP